MPLYLTYKFDVSGKEKDRSISMIRMNTWMNEWIQFGWFNQIKIQSLVIFQYVHNSYRERLRGDGVVLQIGRTTTYRHNWHSGSLKNCVCNYHVSRIRHLTFLSSLSKCIATLHTSHKKTNWLAKLFGTQFQHGPTLDMKKKVQ